jgi:hypothetical protein
MPIERRSVRMQTTTVVISVVALAVAVVLVVLIVQASGSGPRVTVALGDDTFTVGPAEARAETIARDGPLLFSDVSGGGQRRPIFVSHAGGDHRKGWNIFDARPPDAPEGCFLEWRPAQARFGTTCDERTYPADGGDLPHYSWKVTREGDLVVDLRQTVPAAR